MTDLSIEATYSRCSTCGKSLGVDHRVTMSYVAGDIEKFGELGELGWQQGVRVRWTHVDCDDPKLETGWYLTPSVQHDIKTGEKLKKGDLLQVIYRIISVAPDLIFSDRFYFLRRKSCAT